jgi:hypothetical protein
VISCEDQFAVEDGLTTIFDYLTIAGFLITALAFLLLTERDIRTLMRVLISGIVFAIANQVGNHGLTTLGIILVAGGAAFAAFAIRAGLSGSSQ